MTINSVIKYMNQRQHIFFLAALVFGTLLLNFWWISLDSGEVHRTELPRFLLAHYYSSSSDFSNYYAIGLYPPAYFAIPAYFCRYLSLDFNHKNCTFLNSIYVVLALVGMFLLGCTVLKKPIWGVFSSLILTSFPLFLYASKKFIMEISIAPLVILAIYLLIVNRKWDNFMKSVLFGIISGIGCLFKWSFLLYITGPFIFGIIYALTNNPFNRKRILLSVILTLLIGIIICGIWYAFYFDYPTFLFEFIQGFLKDAPHINESYWRFLMSNIPRETKTLARGISTLFLLVFFICFIAKWNKIKEYFATQLLIVWLVVPLIVFYFLPDDTSPRYLLPLIPALAILLSLAVDKFSSKAKVGLIIVIIIMCLWNILYETLIYRPPQKIQQNTFLPIIEKILSSSDSKTSSLKIAFNGFHDSENWGEVRDIFYMFRFYNINNNFNYDTVFFNENIPVGSFYNYDYIVSQDTNINRSRHHQFISKGYGVISRFKHRYREDVDSLFDWESDPEYIIFKK